MPTETVATPTAATTALPTGTWQVDKVHSSVEFQVKHLGIATVKGQFTEFEGTLEVGPENTVAYGTVQVASVNTREPQRDEHLRSADFFDAEQHPEISFRSTAIRPVDEDDLRDRRRHLDPRHHTTADAESRPGGHRDRPSGHPPRRCLGRAQINRSDFEMKFNAALGSGNVRRQRQGQDPARHLRRQGLKRARAPGIRLVLEPA